MSRATLQAIEDAIQAHHRDVLDEEEDPADREPGILTSWVLFTEHQTGQFTESGDAYWKTGYTIPDSSPSSCIGVAELGLAEMKADLA